MASEIYLAATIGDLELFVQQPLTSPLSSQQRVRQHLPQERAI